MDSLPWDGQKRFLLWLEETAAAMSIQQQLSDTRRKNWKISQNCNHDTRPINLKVCVTTTNTWSLIKGGCSFLVLEVFKTPFEINVLHQWLHVGQQRPAKPWPNPGWDKKLFFEFTFKETKFLKRKFTSPLCTFVAPYEGIWSFPKRMDGTLSPPHHCTTKWPTSNKGFASASLA